MMRVFVMPTAQGSHQPCSVHAGVEFRCTDDPTHIKNLGLSMVCSQDTYKYVFELTNVYYLL